MVNMAKDSGMPKPLPQSLVPSRSGSTHKLAANIKVVVRVRPFNQREFEQNNRIIIDVIDDRMLVFDPKEMIQPFYYHGVQQPNKNFLKRANKELKFVFDHVCGLNATNQDVFETATKDILASLMEGYNCSVFVYGATGAGKTFTMIGTKENPGITYLTMDHLFETIHGFEMEREFVIDVSYMEVYNENVYDLLKPSGTPLQLREDAKYGVVVAGLTYHSINTARELLDMLENGNKNRTQHPTDANAESSRSHAIFQVYLKMRCKTSSRCSIVKLSMIDLAGSERASATGCIGERFKEGANINRSLLSLGNCINKLADGGSYIPYRDSKLTRILKDSLGGNCKTVMIANVSPSSLSYEDTYNTLKYAARANKIQMSLKKNIVGSDMKLSQCLKLVKDLEKKAEESDKTIKELRAKLALTAAVKEPVVVNNKGKQDNWIQRINEAECAHSALESNLLTLMSQQRILALRHFLRTRAFSHVADLAYRSSSDALEQICTEEIPRQERAAESYLKRCAYTDSKIKNVWTKWRESSQRLQALLKQAIADCPDLIHFVDKIKLQAEQRLSIATNDLRHKVSAIMNEEILVSTDCMSDAYNMLKKLYLILKGNDMVPPVLTDEYLEIINKAKSAKVIHWSDETVQSNPHFEYITSLDLENPTQKPESGQDVSENINVTIDINTDSDFTDVENLNPQLSAKKRKGTPIKLANNETIIIDDSMEALDTTRNLNSAKKYKQEPNPSVDVENFVSINPQDLNSTFVLAGKMAALKKEPKIEAKTLPVKRGLTDSTNIIHRTVNFNNDNKARIVKPVIPMRRVAVAAPVPRGPAFGSSVGRDGSTLSRTVQGGTKKTVIQNSVGFKAIHARDRPNTHPYSRPALSNAMRRPEVTRK